MTLQTIYAVYYFLFLFYFYFFMCKQEDHQDSSASGQTSVKPVPVSSKKPNMRDGQPKQQPLVDTTTKLPSGAENVTTLQPMTPLLPSPKGKDELKRPLCKGIIFSIFFLILDLNVERREGQVERVTRALHESNDGDGEYDDDDEEDLADDNNQTKIIPTEGNTDQVHVVEVN